MARLSETDRKTLQMAKKWTAPDRPPMRAFGSLDEQALVNYMRWASDASRFFKGTKPVRFIGDKWRL